MDKKITPLLMVVREMVEHSSLDETELERALRGVLEHLQSRTVNEIEIDPESDTALLVAQQYQAVAEVIDFLGTQLIAYEEIEIDDRDRIKN